MLKRERVLFIFVWVQGFLSVYKTSLLERRVQVGAGVVECLLKLE